MTLTTSEKGKVNNSAKSSPGNSKKNSPILNRSLRTCVNVFNKLQENALSSLVLDGKPDLDKRNQLLLEWGMEPTRMLIAGAGVGRCGIAKDEASFAEEIERVTVKMTNGLLDHKNGKLICPICARKVEPTDSVEFSHWLSKSETEFRQHAENVDWTHVDCNRIYGDRPTLEDVNKFFETIGEGTTGIAGNKQNILSKVMDSIEASKNYSFDSKNRPFKIQK